MMGLSSMFNALTNRVDEGGDRASGRRSKGAPSKWLIYGLAAVVLLYVLGRVSLSLAGLSNGAPGGSAGGNGTGAVVTASAGSGANLTAQPGRAASSPRYYEQVLAAELEALLSKVRGAGRVAVSVSLARGPSYVFGHNTTSDSRETEERDSTGSTRTVREATTSQQPVIMRDGSQGEAPLISEEERPQVAGVLILSEGAGDSVVRLDLMRAVQALFELPAHRITVLPMGR